MYPWGLKSGLSCLFRSVGHMDERPKRATALAASKAWRTSESDDEVKVSA